MAANGVMSGDFLHQLKLDCTNLQQDCHSPYTQDIFNNYVYLITKEEEFPVTNYMWRIIIAYYFQKVMTDAGYCFSVGQHCDEGKGWILNMT